MSPTGVPLAGLKKEQFFWANLIIQRILGGLVLSTLCCFQPGNFILAVLVPPHAHVVNRSLQRYAQSTLFYFSGCLGNLLITQGYCCGCALWLCAVDVSWWLRAVAVIIVGVCVFVTMFVVVLVFVVVCCGCVFVAVCCGCVCV